jgi:hypothetical protein
MGALPEAQGSGEGDSGVAPKGVDCSFLLSAHPLTDGSVWVSSPVPALVSSTYSQYWEYSD